MSQPIEWITLDEPTLSRGVEGPWTGQEPHLGGEAALARLLQAMRRWHTRPAASQALLLAGKPAVPGLITLLNDPNPGVRIAVCTILGRLPDPRGVEALKLMLWDAHELVRSEAARALGAVAEPSAIPHLVRLLQDIDIWVRREAAQALGGIGQAHPASMAQAADALIAVMQDASVVRQAALEALVRCGSGALPVLLRSLASASPNQRTAAINGLVRLAHQQPGLVQPHLHAALAQQNPLAQRAAAQALDRIGPL